jgi:hypothetical protein
MQVSVCNACLRAVTREISSHFLLSPLSPIDIYKFKCVCVCVLQVCVRAMIACEQLPRGICSIFLLSPIVNLFKIINGLMQ